MFQSFEVTSTPEKGPKRLALLREEIAREGLDGFLVPRADAHQGEYVAPCDARLAWLTGFTGSAGFCAALMDRAGVFVDGRYRTQVKSQVDLAHFTPVDWPETTLAEWLKQALPDGGKVGFDPWLHTVNEIADLKKALKGSGVRLEAVGNLVDAIWQDQPQRPRTQAIIYPKELSGKSAGQKRGEIGAELEKAGHHSAILTLPDSICWLLNIRGSDIPRIPIIQGFALFNWTDEVHFFTNASFDGAVLEHLGPEVHLHPIEGFLDYLSEEAHRKTYRIDPATAPVAILLHLEKLANDTRLGFDFVKAQDPCILPKARKNAAEIVGTRAAHLRDGVAMVNFLAWLDDTAPKGGLTEIDVVTKLETFRRDTNALRDISFETICGAGPNGAIIHYRVTEETNREIRKGELLLVDSGGQYLDGTTDITRTVAVGEVGDDEKACFTRVLQGMIAISCVRFPKGLAGRDLDALARFPLWLAGQDYNHGTGHGVGTYLSVHEGPQRISKVSDVPLEAGMILSNEPGYYRESAFGIRIENLIVVQPAPALQGADDRDMMAFETLTYVPIDKRLIQAAMLSKGERDWLNAYHAQTFDMLSPLVTGKAFDWLTRACTPL